MFRNVFQLIVLVLAMFACQCANGKPVTFSVDDPSGRDLVSFSSVAPLEMVQGHTSRIFGKVTIDDSMDLNKTPLEAKFDVDLRTLTTGIAMRDDDMRNDFLDATQYPMANFSLKSLKAPVVLEPGKTQHLIAVGQFSLHGLVKPMVVPVDVTYYPESPATQTKVRNANLMQINCEFPILFQDWGIKRPSVMFQKLADFVTVKVNATAYCMLAKPDNKSVP